MVWRSRVGDNLDTATTTVATMGSAFPPPRSLCLPRGPPLFSLRFPATSHAEGGVGAGSWLCTVSAEEAGRGEWGGEGRSEGEPYFLTMCS